MKNVKKYLYIAMALTLSASIFAGCSDDDKNSWQSISAKPSEKFNTKIHFVSRLTDAPLATTDADFSALNTYLTTTLNKKEGSWMTILDRADAVAGDAKMSKYMQLALNSTRWTSFAFNRIVSKTNYQGSILLFNEPVAASTSVPSKDAYVTAFTPKMVGTRADVDEAGNSIFADVSFNINFRTVRFTNNDQLTAFGGETGVMNTLKRQYMNMLVIGTVKNDLFGALETTVAGTDPSFIVYKVAAGSEYSVFMLAEQRFWGLTKCSTTSLGGGIEAYTIETMW